MALRLARSRHALRALLRAAAACAVLTAPGCDVPRAADPEARVFQLGSSLALVELPESVLRALNQADGKTLWEYRPRVPRRTPFGRYASVQLDCPPQLTADGAVHLVYSRALVALDAGSGQERWKHTERYRAACPTATADSGMCLAVFKGGTVGLLKLDSQGRESWRVQLPDIGPPSGALQTAPLSGDVLVRTRTHLASVSPHGEINWIRELQPRTARP